MLSSKEEIEYAIADIERCGFRSHVESAAIQSVRRVIELIDRERQILDNNAMHYYLHCIVNIARNRERGIIDEKKEENNENISTTKN